MLSRLFGTAKKHGEYDRNTSGEQIYTPSKYELRQRAERQRQPLPAGARSDEYDYIVDQDGEKIWLDDQNRIHRVGAPASISFHTEQWMQNGNLHREGGLPARIYRNGDWECWENGNLHNLHGPAANKFGGEEKPYYIDWKRLSHEEFEQHPQVVALRATIAGSEKKNTAEDIRSDPATVEAQTLHVAPISFKQKHLTVDKIW